MPTLNKQKTDSKTTEFHCHAPAAQQVYLAGSFNDWNATADPMNRSDDGPWATALALPPGRHEYKFVIDGAWCCEPGCEGSMAEARCSICVANDHGTMNRVIDVK